MVNSYNSNVREVFPFYGTYLIAQWYKLQLVLSVQLFIHSVPSLKCLPEERYLFA